MVYETVELLPGGGRGLANSMLKNVGLICNACSAGAHWDCDLLNDPTKKMCMCAYNTHPYMTKEQLTPKAKQILGFAGTTRSGAIATEKGIGSSELRTAPAAAQAGLRVPAHSKVSNP